MKQQTRNSQSSDSESSSPSNRSRSREKKVKGEKETENNKINKFSHRNNNTNNSLIDGKLYLSNIPLTIPQPKILEEFGKYGRIVDFSFRKKTDIPNPYYFGYITLNGKLESENAIENITKNYNWTITPFGEDFKDKNNKEKNLNKNINIISFLNKKINNQEDKVKNILSSDSKNINLNNNLNLNLNNIINIREIWVTNLPLSTDEAKLYKEFFIYGEISKIELKIFFDKKNAYIKYRLCDSAKKAIEKENNIYFNGNIINVSYSNENQRKDIKGNENGFELNEYNCKLIFVCLNKNIETVDEDKILNIFEIFGKIKYVSIKNINDRNHIFIEYYKYEDAQKSVIEMNKDINIDKRRILGDENCEINYFFKSKNNEANPFLNRMNNNNIINNVNSFKNNQNCPKNNLNSFGCLNPVNIFQMLQNNILNKGLNNNYNMLNNNLNNNLQNQNQHNMNINQYKNNINNDNLYSSTNFYHNSINNNQLNNLNLTNQLLNLIKNNSNNSLQTSKMAFSSINPTNPINSSLFQNFKGFIFPQNFQNPNPNPNINQNNLSLSLLLNNPIFSNIINNNFRNNLNCNIANTNNTFPLNNNNIQINNNNIPINNNLSNNNKDKPINNNYSKTLNNNIINNNKNSINNNKSIDMKILLKQIMSEKNKKKANNNSDSDISSLNSNQSIEEMDFEKEYSLEEENLKYIWNGYLTKNNKEKVNIDIFKIRGNIDDNYFKGYHFNICNRIHYEEVLKKHLLGIVVISPNNITQKEIFDQYIKYFDEKRRCGVINLSEKYILYLASPGDFSKKFYINPKKHLLGLIIDNTVEPNLYIDMNNLSLPPPVISLNEKRRLMCKNKKKENKKGKKDFTRNNRKNNNDYDELGKEKEIMVKVNEEQNKLNENKDNEEVRKKKLEKIISQNPKIKNIIEQLTKKVDNEY